VNNGDAKRIRETVSKEQEGDSQKPSVICSKGGILRENEQEKKGQKEGDGECSGQKTVYPGNDHRLVQLRSCVGQLVAALNERLQRLVRQQKKRRSFLKQVAIDGVGGA
jgi:hypothetical protein